MAEPQSARKLAWPPTKEELERLYLNEKLSARNVAKIYGLEYKNPKVAESTVLYHLKRNGIPRRERAEHLRKIDEAMVDNWALRYKAGESLKKIAGDSVSPTSVLLHLKKRGVVIRDKVEAQIKAVTKHPRESFRGGKEEQAYLIGFAKGDLNVTSHGRAIRIKTSSTHPMMIEHIKKLFQAYGHGHVSPRKSKLTGYEWNIQFDLDPSFCFLFGAKSLPEWVFSKDCMTYFTAGLFDAEGSIWCNKSTRHFELSITNSDNVVLEKVADGLNQLGLSPYLGFSRRNRVWKLQFWRPDEVHKFISVIPVRHPEKVAKILLVKQLGEGLSPEAYDRLIGKWDLIISGIKNDRDEFVGAAKRELAGEHGSG